MGTAGFQHDSAMAAEEVVPRGHHLADVPISDLIQGQHRRVVMHSLWLTMYPLLRVALVTCVPRKATLTYVRPWNTP